MPPPIKNNVLVHRQILVIVKVTENYTISNIKYIVLLDIPCELVYPTDTKKQISSVKGGMDMIDYLTVMLLNLVAGLFVLAFFVVQLKDIDEKGLKKFIPVFLVIGFIMMLTGLHMSFTWPLPGSYNIAYGEMSLLIGVLFLGAALHLAMGWNLLPLTIVSFFGGIAAILLGVRISNLELTQHPGMSSLGFILVGAFAVLTPAIYQLRKVRALAYFSIVILVAAGVVWILTTYGAYWSHMESFAEWVPATMR